MSTSASAKIAVIGAGIAGVTCARLLADAGHSVRLFDKSRGIGGRMSTRRVEWVADDGVVCKSAFDHGAPGFTARSPDFVRFVEQAQRDGLLAHWEPVTAPNSFAPHGESALWVPTPDMPSLCRRMLADISINATCAVDAMRRGPHGWNVESAGTAVAQGFSTVVLAIPPQQSALLLQPHNTDWAERAQALPMLPVWTLMGVTADIHSAPSWDMAWPVQGPLSCVVRNDAKPGRERVPELAHWVVHATAPWSQTYLETPAENVQAMLREALDCWLGRSLNWHHAAVHRWRYASVPGAVQSASEVPLARCWWDPSLGLGVCGDALGGGGVEGAWTSARALATALIDRYRAGQVNSARTHIKNTLRPQALMRDAITSLGLTIETGTS